MLTKLNQLFNLITKQAKLLLLEEFEFAVVSVFRSRR